MHSTCTQHRMGQIKMILFLCGKRRERSDGIYWRENPRMNRFFKNDSV
ncbi:Leo1, Paf1/RNA polymerase II complex component, homolog (S. cerevisiae), isoform CRA_c [Rattus norvegicus]|uniref:Leo1, Paf1/RNA polymerase II complex component, homolog (S. cerevisiae), isoform CRA_c n=1 Tax=Rattus norvegicus TaxID=10116 RepID=A6I1D1_RAT|nr:Leo1, Paf1/RNA polymerase II complex component, homolog (S. cerevisiae), isoform CRA_c [Rattus norvegicus]